MGDASKASAVGGAGSLPRLELRALLGPGGALSRALPNYEPRQVQLEMAERVQHALARGRALVVEAGTGTGKTLAYLLPAALSGLKVVISTATKTLQEQLAEKDVPLLTQLGVPAKVAFMKGRQNYLCLLRKEQWDQNPMFTIGEEAQHFEEIQAWSRRTETGDKAELSTVPENAALFRELTSTADSCTGQKCAHYDRCFVFKMRRQAGEADVVVVNHHLFFADLALRSSSAGDLGAAVIPRYDAVIFDEAHAVEEVATEHFGAQVSSHRVGELARDAQKTLSGKPGRMAARDLAARLGREGGEFFQAALLCRPEEQRGGNWSPGPGSQPSSRRSPATTGSSASGRSSLRRGEPDARWAVEPGSLLPAEAERQALLELLRGLGAELSRGEEDDELSLLERRCTLLAADLVLFTPGEQDPSRRDAEEEDPTLAEERRARAQDGEGAAGPAGQLVRWAEQRGGHLFLHASPLEVAGLLQDRLYDRIGPVVFTSATLAVGGTLSYFERRIGLSDIEGPLFPTDEAVLASPFDYQTHAALYLPRSMPEPQDPGFPEAVAAELRGLLPITSGCAFALFTSLRNMRAVHALLEGELRAHGLQVLLQGERPKQQLLRSFKERASVLFASQSFWEGVDVPGDALRLVVIDKLPFASPGEPLVAARIERLRQQGEEPFRGYQVPQAALALKQGFGRLIRNGTDHGIVAVLDPRVTQKSYGRIFLATLPKCRVARSLDEVRQFWQGRQA